ncbi:PKD domain-containing protein [Iamia sp. SCSIO 61187]|uniref:PKD domain-containing protein n=1 Tax=Iamia sp. SCSIO 61187 TaxID=2722752 RepID=UPI001C62AE4A|nr:PKD domain-containing protein [Iamia sp. SCSIO 61187]QYG91236.1 PKD domain-containing protein [Iamia sp. SCSIO 61187]
MTTNRRTRRTRAAAATATVVVATMLGALVVATGPAGGVAPVAAAHSTQVNALPNEATPHALDGSVRTVAVVGDTVFMGGDFTQAANPDRTPVARSWILAFDKATGVVRSGWAPQLDGTVHSIVPAEDGQSVYVAGAFKTVNGARQPKVARLRVSDGGLMDFKPAVDATVYTLALVGNRLWMGGVFKNIQGRSLRVAAVDAQTAVIDDRMSIPFTGTHHGIGDGKIWRIEPSPDGRHVLVGGSFSAVGGQPRGQIAKIDIAADGTPTLSPWSTTRYAPTCASSIADSLRDISYSPDGSYFVIGTSGGLPSNDNSTLCDTTARWEDTDTPNSQPTWVNPTGGDSVYSVEVSGAAVYVGGHFRWSNNVNGRDRLMPGGVGREGIAALDPANGVPLSWNPGRDRGQAVWQMLSTPDGLYVASDTDRIARYLYRGRIAFFPVAGGAPVPQPANMVLPGAFHQYVPSGPARVISRSYDGTTVGNPETVATPPSDFSNLTGAFRVDGTLYTAHSDGTLRARSYDGTTFGPPTTINLYGLSAFASELSNVRGITYSAGRLYYGLSGSTSLFSRGFSVESRIVAGARTTVATSSSTTLHYGNVGSMVVIGDQLYYSDTRNTTLRRGTFSPTTGIDPATITTVSPSGPGGIAWSTGELWGVQGAIPNQAPTAAFTSTCTGMSCAVDASDSTDGDGEIASVQWDFGDGGTATGTTADHRYADAGTYTITVTVTDDDGAVGSATRSVTVTGPQVVGTSSSTGNQTKTVHTVTVPAGVQPGDQLVLFNASNATGTMTANASAGWTRVIDASTSGSRHGAFVRTAVAGDAGSTVSVTFSGYAKADLTVVAYRGVTLGATAGQAGYTTPVVAATPGAWAVSYWADKSATTTAITPPAAVTIRFERTATGAGHLTETLGDVVATGTTVGGLTGTPAGGAPVANAAAMTLVLVPS